VDQAWSRLDPLAPPDRATHARWAHEAWTAEQAWTGNPGDGRTAARLGDLRFLLGAPEDAAAWYERAFAADPGLRTAERLARHGTALLHLERNREAKAALDEALARDPENGRALLSSAAYEADISGNRAAALDLLHRAAATGQVRVPPDFRAALEHDLN
jgi:tetratricopeptide (TPR) repeat protein